MDVGIAVDLIKMSEKKVADAFVLVSGDEDFTSAVKLAKENLCNVFVAFCSDDNYGIYGSEKLSEEADDRLVMDPDFLENCAF